ncbi:SET family sugar efflux transporter-like MFS transporter [Deinobacterium chartae]|uniref:SET family sugar efflux transporter-like MFS transporter n=1 Tax=Deinobacterium chartae TaxID=521158 RepID=A0A841I535_9DEIO|nr:sugar efflux transporter [Deinobacterium chartae]MBB6100136.1 SET family sugar efflux transporter-like MFS transporter [Deinobacterium chartae]
MQSNALLILRRLPGYPRLSLSVLLLGFATSFAGPYITLFGANEAGMSPFALGLFMTLMSVSSIIISHQLGRWSDRLSSRRPLVLLSALAGALGYLLLCTTHNYLLLTLIACLFLGTGAAAFPQLFAYAKAQLGSAQPQVAEHAITTLRSVFSLAWVIGPAVGAALLAWGNFVGLFVGTALTYLLAMLPVFLSSSRGRAAANAVPSGGAVLAQPAPTRPVMLIALSFVLYGMSNSMAALSLPLFVTGTLGGTNGDVGFLIGLCALLEIPVMLSFVLLPRRFTYERVILFGLALFTLYPLLVFFSQSMWMLALSQAVRAVVIAITACLGMAYFQELMPGRIGAATTLFANTTSAGSMLAGIVSGSLAQAFGYQGVFLGCAVLALVAFVLLFVIRAPRGGSPTS